MTRLVALSGSLRKASFNTALARAAAQAMPEGTHMEVHTLHGVPLYDADLEAGEGTPAPVLALKRAILAADGLLLVTPEYNNGIPGVFKNGFDWLSSPTPDVPDVFEDRPVAVIGASPGAFGTLSGQTAWLPVLRAVGARIWTGGRLMVPHAKTAFDGQGRLVDEAITRRLRDVMAGFAAFAAR